MPVDFSSRFNENEVGAIEFQYSNRDLSDLLKMGCVRQGLKYLENPTAHQRRI